MRDDTTDLDGDDPLVAQLRAARPTAPASLERDVLARIAARGRPRRMPIVVGCAVALGAIVCLALVLPDAGDRRAITGGDPIARADAAPAGPADAATVWLDAAPPATPPGWTEIDTMWATTEAAHRTVIGACGGSGSILIHVERQRDGRAVASHVLPGLGRRGPTPHEQCRMRAAAAIELPPMPPDLIAVELMFSLVPEPRSAPGWADPMATIARAFAAANLGACSRTATAKLTLVVDRTAGENPRIWLPRFQFGGDGVRAADTSRCVAKQLAGHRPPPLPPFLRAITLHHRVAR